MARTPKKADAKLNAEMRQVAASARDAATLRKAMAVLLIDIGVSLPQAAEVLGRSLVWLKKQRMQIFDSGGVPLAAARGGARKLLFKSDALAAEFLAAHAKEFTVTKGDQEYVSIGRLRACLDTHLHRKWQVTRRTVYQLVDRHGLKRRRAK